MESKFVDIRTDFEDDNGVIHLDGFKTEDENEEGIIIGFFTKGEIYWRDPEFQFDPYVKEIVAELKADYEKRFGELKEKIHKAVSGVVYTGDAKPRLTFTDGSPLKDKLSLIDSGVDEIMKLL